MKAIHLISNDRKYLQHVIEVMEAVNPGNNKFIVRKGGDDTSSNLLQDDLRFFARDDTEYRKAVGRHCGWADVILIHGLDKLDPLALTNLRDETVVVWCVWGADIFAALSGSTTWQQLPKTRALAGKARYLRGYYRLRGKLDPALGKAVDQGPPPRLQRFVERLADLTLSVRSNLPNKKNSSDAEKLPEWSRDFAPRIDFVASLDAKDVHSMKSLGFKAAPLPEFKYYTFEHAFDRGPMLMVGSDILIGNRASPSCNHVEAFSLVEQFGKNAGRIIVPLNYGGRIYGDLIDEIARRKFGDRAVTIRDWMDIDTYSQTISTCGTLIMNHVRGQGLGTSAMALAKGARVFFLPANPHYRFLRKLGAKVCSLESNADLALIGQPADPQDQRHNREIVEAYWSTEQVNARALEILDTSQELHKRRQHTPSIEKVPSVPRVQPPGSV